ncbi:hypothetical protein [Photobacterium proteolyticum]|uniref:hypothetical protein n=1 Tax=Photobacterium proteolyticum TaxID=1903952 RepID=UPI0011150E87|nr:hypothetical protein [Photobacterium proteolyticum]
MLKKIQELQFFKLFGLIAAYFICSLLLYRVFRSVGHGDEVLFGLGIASVAVTGVLFWALMAMRKKGKSKRDL